ncbi:DNA-directed RNA polymerase II subunit RPB1 [Frankliniella fusca]|uniref:DNA-directed RNA polymerase II subunit RPB1 n=1 Tax=Frankliniella fusca TaxID=407009 RepID=A0AAE1LE51_9NEOP|nr:DNA-directed RNA polymerase II subunit RPB1 [Frankliniella fusca]
MSFKIIQLQSGGRKLVSEGFTFHLRLRRNDKTYWKCAQRNCPSTAITTRNNRNHIEIQNSTPHTHDPSEDREFAEKSESEDEKHKSDEGEEEQDNDVSDEEEEDEHESDEEEEDENESDEEEDSETEEEDVQWEKWEEASTDEEMSDEEMSGEEESEAFILHIEKDRQTSKSSAPHIAPTAPHISPSAPHISPTAPHISPSAPHISPTAPHIAPTAPHISPSAPHIAPTAPHIAPTAPHISPTAPHIAPTAPHIAPTAPHIAPTAPHISPTAPHKNSVWCYVDVLQREVRVDYKTSISLDANFESTEERTPTRVVLLDPLPEEDDRLNNRTHVVLTPKAPFESWKTLEQLRTEGPVLNTFNGKRCNRPRRPCQ